MEREQAGRQRVYDYYELIACGKES